jgi:hypothetical protein
MQALAKQSGLKRWLLVSLLRWDVLLNVEQDRLNCSKHGV